MAKRLLQGNFWHILSNNSYFLVELLTAPCYSHLDTFFSFFSPFFFWTLFLFILNWCRILVFSVGLTLRSAKSTVSYRFTLEKKIGRRLNTIALFPLRQHSILFDGIYVNCKALVETICSFSGLRLHQGCAMHWFILAQITKCFAKHYNCAVLFVLKKLY